MIKKEKKKKKKSRKKDKKGDKQEMMENVINIFFNSDSELFIVLISTIWVTAFENVVYMAGNIFRI